jgi:hypothetical protein
MALQLRPSACVISLALLLSSAPAESAVYTWIPASRALSYDGTPVQTIVITGSRINWGPGEFDLDISQLTPTSTFINSGSIGVAITQARLKAVDFANVCKNPFVTQDTKETTGSSDTHSRWLAAENLFNIIQAQKLWSSYQGAYGGISIVIDAKSYNGFKVQYADGATETWVVNPGWATSTLRLFDTPAPDSLTPARPGSSCVSG